MSASKKNEVAAAPCSSSSSSSSSSGGGGSGGRSGFVNSVAGGIAGGVSRLAVAPLDLIKIRMQLQPPADAAARQGGGGAPPSSSPSSSVLPRSRLVAVARAVFAEEGLVTFWRGNLAATYLWISYSAAQFGTYYAVREALSRALRPVGGGGREEAAEEAEAEAAAAEAAEAAEAVVARGGGGRPRRLSQSAIDVLSGGVAGVVATLCTYPLDLMRTTFAAQGVPRAHGGMWSLITATQRSSGVRGFYKGCGVAVAGIAPYIGLSFGLYEALGTWRVRAAATAGLLPPPLARLVHGEAGSAAETLSPLWTGALSGVGAKLVVYPLDTLKKRLQVQGLRRHGSTVQPRYRGAMHCLAVVLRTEGVVALYRGTVPTLLKTAPASGITFAVFEWTKRLLERGTGAGARDPQ